MIYQFPEPSDPIKQGDIFKSIPQVYFDPGEMVVIHDGDYRLLRSWMDEIENTVTATIVEVEPVFGIVVTQDCDAERDKYIAFFKIDNFLEVVPKDQPKSNLPKWWMRVLTTHARSEEKWFYLPPDKQIGFNYKMAVDFKQIIPVPTDFLLANCSQLRIGRLNDEADEHFREKVAQYFRRYPYNEWYPLDKAEYEAYKAQSSREDASPYPWQE